MVQLEVARPADRINLLNLKRAMCAHAGVEMFRAGTLRLEMSWSTENYEDPKVVWSPPDATAPGVMSLSREPTQYPPQASSAPSPFSTGPFDGRPAECSAFQNCGCT